MSRYNRIFWGFDDWEDGEEYHSAVTGRPEMPPPHPHEPYKPSPEQLERERYYATRHRLRENHLEMFHSYYVERGPGWMKFGRRAHCNLLNGRCRFLDMPDRYMGKPVPLKTGGVQ